MREINLDARNWKTMMDFCRDLLPALQAPEWHSCSYDALLETMIWYDDVNGVKPPYVVRVSNLGIAPKAVQVGVVLMRDLLVETRQGFNVENGRDVEVSMDIVDEPVVERYDGFISPMAVPLKQPPSLQLDTKATEEAPQEAGSNSNFRCVLRFVTDHRS